MFGIRFLESFNLSTHPSPVDQDSESENDVFKILALSALSRCRDASNSFFKIFMMSFSLLIRSCSSLSLPTIEAISLDLGAKWTLLIFAVLCSHSKTDLLSIRGVNCFLRTSLSRVLLSSSSQSAK